MIIEATGGVPRSEPNGNDMVSLLIATRKGGFILDGDRDRANWQLRGPFYLGSEVNHLVLDPRDQRTLVMAARSGHLGPTIFLSTDAGASWKEAEQPPAFPKAPDDAPGRTVHHNFWLTPGHAAEPNVWYVGTSPHGLFRSEDGGNTWKGVDGFNNHAYATTWSVPEMSPPGGPTLHSVLIDPRSADHMYLGMSLGGFFESKDKGATWTPINRGVASDFLPDPDSPAGHDTHCVTMSPVNPDRIYQQNHCGVYRLDRPGVDWDRIGRNIPAEIGDIGFPCVAHPRDENTLWVAPMDGTDVWPRTSVSGHPAIFRSTDGGQSWNRQSRGLPTEKAWFTVKRQAMAVDRNESAGVYFGTSNGEIWASADEGESWNCILQHLPEVWSVEAATFG